MIRRKGAPNFDVLALTCTDLSIILVHFQMTRKQRLPEVVHTLLESTWQSMCIVAWQSLWLVHYLLLLALQLSLSWLAVSLSPGSQFHRTHSAGLSIRLTGRQKGRMVGALSLVPTSIKSQKRELICVRSEAGLADYAYGIFREIHTQKLYKNCTETSRMNMKVSKTLCTSQPTSQRHK